MITSNNKKVVHACEHILRLNLSINAIKDRLCRTLSFVLARDATLTAGVINRFSNRYLIVRSSEYAPISYCVYHTARRWTNGFYLHGEICSAHVDQGPREIKLGSIGESSKKSTAINETKDKFNCSGESYLWN